MKRSTLWKTFAAPVVVGVLISAGLFAALLGDGWWDTLAWLGMGISAVLSIRGLLARSVQEQQSKAKIADVQDAG
ncbi:hypothetical protein ACTUVN_003543 [Pseudomonas caspiana]